MRVLFLAIFALALIISPVWCAERTQKVVLLMDHAGESNFNNLLQAGLKLAANEFGIIGKTKIASADENQAEIFRQTAEEADLVIVATDNLHEILRDNAANFRSVMFGAWKPQIPRKRPH